MLRARTRAWVPAKDLDAGPVLRVKHRDVGNRDVRYDVRLAGVLSRCKSSGEAGGWCGTANLPEATDGDAVRTVAPHVGNDYVGAVRLECCKTS